MDRVSVFISYSSKEKSIGGRFKSCLERYCGYETFIAHDDIPPSSVWEEEILHAITKADFFIPLISEAFKKSNFTDQETGIAVSLNKKIIPIKLDSLNPYGFINKYQAMQYRSISTSDTILDNSKKLVLAIAQVGVSFKQYHQKAIDSLIYAFCNSASFESTNAIIEILSHYDHFTKDQLKKIIYAIKNNRQIREAWGLSLFKKFLHDQYNINID